jgi:hypothetical protein
MSVETEALIRITSEWALLVQSLAIALAFVRLVRGPDAADRIAECLLAEIEDRTLADEPSATITT